MKRVLALICMIALPLFAKADDEVVYLNLEIFQTLSKTEALARTNGWDIVKIKTEADIYYDGKKIADNFVFVDTYSYTTKDFRTKTVPVYIRQSEYNASDKSKAPSEKYAIKQLSVEVIQVLESGVALARTSDYDIVRIEAADEVFYDGKKINGKYTLVDTYSYTTRNFSDKTVPLYVKVSERKNNATSKPKYTVEYISVEIFQTLSKTEALARTSDWDVVKLETTTDVYYDGKKISGNFVMAGTYNYTNKSFVEKTVPVYIRESEYKKLMEE